MRSAILSLVLLIVTLVATEEAMAAKKVLASPVEGQLVADAGGTPVSGITVVRRWKWGWTGGQGEDRTTTDAEGRFSFGEVTGRSLTAGLVPHEPSVDQDFLAELDSGQSPLLILGLQKSNYDANGETQGRPMRIRCRTDLEPDARGFYWGTCELID